MSDGERCACGLSCSWLQPLGPNAAVAIAIRREVENVAIRRPARFVIPLSTVGDFDPRAIGNRPRPGGRRDPYLARLGGVHLHECNVVLIGGEGDLKHRRLRCQQWPILLGLGIEGRDAQGCGRRMNDAAGRGPTDRAPGLIEDALADSTGEGNREECLSPFAALAVQHG